jgi:hypothetical protein
MKNFLLLILLSFSFSLSYSNNLIDSLDYKNLPQYLIWGGDTIGVVLTVEQLQKLDNQTDLVNLLEVMSIKCDDVNTKYVMVINSLEQKIAIMDIKIDNLEEQNLIKDDIIKTLKDQVRNREESIQFCDKQRDNDSKIIDGLVKDLRKSKIKSLVGWMGTGVGMTTAVLLAILLSTK